MKEELNLQCPYSVVLDEEAFIYSFYTSSQIPYKIIFSDSTSFFEGTSVESQIQKVYSLSIEKATIVKEPFDRDVQTTIDCIITHFFEDVEKSLIYMCDNSDEREVARYRKFSIWYKLSSFKEQVVKVDESIESEGLTYYTSIIYHKDNALRFELNKAYSEVIEILRNK